MAYTEGQLTMHYYYGICPSCGQSTYRYPTESFYRHMSGAIECSHAHRIGE